MSSMLEQAILDAKDLKEAAIKNAQQSIIEKYSDEFESEIEKLLEQTTPPTADPLAAAAPTGMAPTIPTTPGMPTPAGVVPVDPNTAKSDSDNKSDIFDKLEYAYKDGEVIGGKVYTTGVVEIDLDSLSEIGFEKNKQTPEQMALQELKSLSKRALKEQLEEEMVDDEDFDDESETFPYEDDDSDEDEDIESDDDELETDDDMDDEDLEDDDMDDVDLDVDIDDEDDVEVDIDDEDLDDKSDEDLYDDDDESEFEIDFETDPNDADYDPDANIEDDDFEDEDSDEEDYEDDEEDDEDYEDEDNDEEDELGEVKISPTFSNVMFQKDSGNKKDKKSHDKNGENKHKHLPNVIRTEKGKKIRGLDEAIKLDYKRTGPRSSWSGMFHEEAEHDVALANLQAEIEALEEEVDTLKESNKKLKAGLKESVKLIEKTTAENKSYVAKINQYEEKLHESRLLNYKLLYTNKALSDASLNERQKNKLAESINGAKTAEEVKLLYETLKSTMRDGTSSGRSPKSLSEAVERRSSSLLLKASRAEAPKQNDYAERMKKLAGLT